MTDIVQRLITFTDEDAVRNMRVEASLEIDRLRKLVRSAYKEAFHEGVRLQDDDGSWSDGASWRGSATRKALAAQP